MSKPDLHNAAEIKAVPSLLDFVRPIRRPEYNFFPISLQDRPYLLNRLNFLGLVFGSCLKNSLAANSVHNAAAHTERRATKYCHATDVTCR
jgi:hypothetical protein